MTARLVKWNRSLDGNVSSKDGRFEIKRVGECPHRPLYFDLFDRGECVESRFPAQTQGRAKLDAEEIVKAEEARRVIVFAEELELERKERQR